MRGATPPLPNTSSWCGTKLSTGTTLLLPLRTRSLQLLLSNAKHIK
jgi:hypothetical protein